jgi:tetratricopeptide (TPR) repeat protein
LISSAREASLSGDHDEAIRQFHENLTKDPNVDLANAHRKSGELGALAGYEHFLEKNPGDTQVLYRIGEIYLAKNDPDKALEYLNRALQEEPNTSWVLNSMGVVYLQKNQQQKAEEYLRKSLEENPKINMAHFNLAQLYETQGKKPEAEKEYLAELNVAPKNFKAHFNLGRLYVNGGKLDSGIQHLTSTVDLAPDFPLGYLFLAEAYVEQGSDFERAIELAKKGLQLSPDPGYRLLSHLILADIYNRMGRYDLEKQELKLAKGA